MERDEISLMCRLEINKWNGREKLPIKGHRRGD